MAPITDLDLSHAVQSDACVLFTGDHETAEALARRLHALSGWRYGPFVAVDCALPDAAPRLLQLLDVEKPEDRTAHPGPHSPSRGRCFSVKSASWIPHSSSVCRNGWPRSERGRCIPAV